MMRKDGQEQLGFLSQPKRIGLGPASWYLALLMAVALVLGNAAELRASSIRVWPDAVVVDGDIHLDDVARLIGFDRAVEKRLKDVVVAPAPPAGGSKLIHMDMVRDAVASSGVNMATVTVRGAMQCSVTRPALSSPATARALLGHRAPTPPHATKASQSEGKAERTPGERTLRKAVVDYFDRQLSRFGGKAEVIFDRASEQVLNLAGDSYTFRVRRRGGTLLGLIPVEVDVVADGRLVQTVPMAVQVTMTQQALMAQRAINQGATIRPADVSLTPVVVTRLSHTWLDSPALAVGQRAKRFISVGTLLERGMIESVPLVKRGQLVSLASVVGGVRVVTAGRAAEDGLLGETITIRSEENKRVTFHAVVTGPGRVEMGPSVTKLARSDRGLGDRS